MKDSKYTNKLARLSGASKDQIMSFYSEEEEYSYKKPQKNKQKKKATDWK